MIYIWGTLSALVSVLLGDWLLRTGVEFQLAGFPQGIGLQVLGGIVAIGLPIVVALLLK